MSITAAKGIPKLEAGPQKSRDAGDARDQPFVRLRVSPGSVSNGVARFLLARDRNASASWMTGIASAGGRFREQVQALGIARTGGADVVQNLVGTDFGIDGFDCGGHFDGNDILGARETREQREERRWGQRERLGGFPDCGIAAPGGVCRRSRAMLIVRSSLGT